MTVAISTAARNWMSLALANALKGGIIQIFTGTQPSSVDSPVAGTLLCTYTNASGTHTAEVLSTGTVTLTGGASGTVDTLTVNSVEIMGAAVTFATDLPTTAALVAAQINRNLSSPDYTATSSGAVVTIHAMPGTGAGPNTYVVACGSTTITTSKTDMASGVSAVNGLDWEYPSGGIINKVASETWSGVAVASGTVGCMRITAGVADANGTDVSPYTQIRVDLSVGTVGTDVIMGTTTIISGTTNTIDAAAFSLPTS